ncbi:hypothetical protein SNEBB_001478 [Seison nebaliae]|nr:hypothetical protein SNEBB_001478 [Seison nebaliae]
MRIDRAKTCPLLLRVFCNMNEHNDLSEYKNGKTPSNGLIIHTWKDASLQEFSQLIKEVNPEARKKGTRFEFRLIYPTSSAQEYLSEDIGSIISGSTLSRGGGTTLENCKSFRIGDFLDVAIIQPIISSSTSASSMYRPKGRQRLHSPPRRHEDYHRYHRTDEKPSRYESNRSYRYERSGGGRRRSRSPIRDRFK